MFSVRYTDISGDFQPQAKLHPSWIQASPYMQVVIHTKFAFSRLEQYGYCL
jgi:hypothetical protein